MKKLQFLFNIVKALTKNEKRHFSLISSSKSLKSNKVYHEIFNLIDEASSINKLKSHLSYKTYFTPNNLNSFQDLIMHTLRNYYSGKLYFYLEEKLLDVKILIHKGLHAEALNEIQKLRKEFGKKFDDNLKGLELAIIERKLKLSLGLNTDLKLLPEKAKEGKDFIKRISKSLEILKDFEVVNYSLISQKYQEKIEESFSASTKEFSGGKFMNKNFKTDFQFDDYYYSLHLYSDIYTYWKESENPELSILLIKYIIKLYEEDEYKIRIELKRYIDILLKYFHKCLLNQHKEEIEKILLKLNAIANKDITHPLIKLITPSYISKEIQSQIQLKILYFKSIYYLTNDEKQYHKAVQLVPEIEKVINQNYVNISKQLKLTFYLNIATSFLLNKQFENSKLWINKIWELHDDESVPSIFILNRLLEIVVLWELCNSSKDLEILEGRIGATMIRLKDYEKTHKNVNRIVLMTLHQLLFSKDEEKVFLLKNLYRELSFSNPNPVQKMYKGILLWIENKLFELGEINFK